MAGTELAYGASRPVYWTRRGRGRERQRRERGRQSGGYLLPICLRAVRYCDSLLCYALSGTEIG
eukprot:573533-Rhodomonas_salina.1